MRSRCRRVCCPRLSHVRLERAVTDPIELTALLVHIDVGRERLRPPVLEARSRIFQHARRNEIARARRLIGRVTRRRLRPSSVTDLEIAARYIDDFPNEYSGRLPGLARRAIEWHRAARYRVGHDQVARVGGRDRPTERPPIPLPYDERIRFLDTVGAVVDEGVEMEHCIGSYAERAVAGESFLFHVDYEGQKASFELGPDGMLRQGFGPRNSCNGGTSGSSSGPRRCGPHNPIPRPERCRRAGECVSASRFPLSRGRPAVIASPVPANRRGPGLAAYVDRVWIRDSWLLILRPSLWRKGGRRVAPGSLLLGARDLLPEQDLAAGACENIIDDFSVGRRQLRIALPQPAGALARGAAHWSQGRAARLNGNWVTLRRARPLPPAFALASIKTGTQSRRIPTMSKKFVCLALFAVALGAGAVVARDIRTERVRFEKGASSATVEASIKGYESVDYVLRASKGQAMNVSMATDNNANYFNIIAPSETDVALFIGSNSGNQYEGVLPESGDYKIRVYLMRSAARRDEIANYRLEMIIAAAGEGPRETGGDVPPSLSDLVGARGSSGERALADRGYTLIDTVKSEGESVAYWREDENGQCVAVRTADGRYASIAYAEAANCKAAPTAVKPGREGGFATVCGVIVESKTYRYRCVARDEYRGSEKAETVLQYPDQTIKLQWKDGNRVEVQFEGMVPLETTYATAEGETNFVFEGKTYFFISNKDMARWELEHFDD